MIEIVTLDRIQPLAPHQAGSGMLAQLRNGQAIEGKVLAMLEGSVARLEIQNQTIDISLPRSLKAGTPVSIMLDSDGRSLKLVAQTGAQAARPQSAGASEAARLADALVSIAAQMALNEALSASEAFAQESPPAPGRLNPDPHQAASLPPPAANLPPAPGAPAHLQADIRTLYSLPPPPQAYDSTQGWVSSAPLLSSYSAGQAQQALLPPGAQSAANSAAGLIIPFQLPQMPYPVTIAVKEEDESEQDRARGRPPGKRWRVAVSLDAGAMGPVDVNIGLSAGAVSVSLAAHQAQSVSHLAAWLPELKAALEQSGFAVEELSVRETAAGAGGDASALKQPLSL